MKSLCLSSWFLGDVVKKFFIPSGVVISMSLRLQVQFKVDLEC